MPAEQSNPANVRRERQSVLKASVAEWPELVEASQAGYLECLAPFLREARAACWIFSALSGRCALVDILGHEEHRALLERLTRSTRDLFSGMEKERAHATV